MIRKKCTLSVNINKLATLRNSRGGNVPNILQCTKDLIEFGAEGITVHPRPDERHIRKSDVYTLAHLLKKINKTRSKNKKIEFNIEGYPNSDFLNLVKKVRPDQVTLVPDPPEALTSNAGWDLAKSENNLNQIIQYLKNLDIRVSLFVDVYNLNKADYAALLRLKPERIELYTEKFAKDYVTKKCSSTTRKYALVAKKIHSSGIDINAGHDLNLENVRYLLKNIPEIIECSIGHALIGESLYFGFKSTISQYLTEMNFSNKKLKKSK